MSRVDEVRLGDARAVAGAAAAGAAEIDAIESAIARFRSGDLPAERFRLFRLAHGIYGQRQPGVHMVRIKIPSGAASARQLTAIADLAERFSTGVAHLTTRQDIQFHFVALERVPDLLRGLAAAGLTTREACGNNVRNVTACPLAGDLADEAFDVRPFALATAAFFVRQAFCQQMARKFKLAFSACPEDCAATAIHDIGVLGRSVREAGGVRHGFKVLVGGGLGAAPFVAQVLDEFVPAADLLPVLKAILQVFADHGNRRVRTKARLKFVVHRVGIERFRALVAERRAAMTADEVAEADLRRWVPGDSAAALAAVIAGGAVAPRAVAPVLAVLAVPAVPAEPAVPPGVGPAATTDAVPPADGGGDDPFGRWLESSVRAHRDPERAIVTIMVPLGDLEAGPLRRVAGLAGRFSDGQARLTREQNLVLPAVRRAHLAELRTRLAALGLDEPSAGGALDVVSCPGADTCALGITSSKGLARAIRATLRPLADNGAAGALRGMTIKISGCPNACAQHHVAGIGLHGAARNVGGRTIPAYQLHIGGATGPGSAHLGAAVARVPARRVPAAVAAVIGLFARERRGDETLADFTGRVPAERLRDLLAPFAALPDGAGPAGAVTDAAGPDAGAPEPLDVDWGQTGSFSTDALGREPAAAAADGEPFAHVRADLDQAARFMEQGLWPDALATISRARFALARVLVSASGRRTDSDYETACEMRARVIDRGHADETWSDLHRDIETALRPRTPDPLVVRALHSRACALLAGSPAVLGRLQHGGAAGAADAENPGA